MTTILCKTITANTSHSKTILELSNDDQSLYLFFLLSHYSLSLFYISVPVQKTHIPITSIPGVLPIHLLRQVKALFSHRTARLESSSSKRCFYLRRSQFKNMIQDFFVLIFQRVRFLEDLEDCSCFVQLMTLDLISLQF